MMRTLGYQTVDLVCDLFLSVLNLLSASFEWVLVRLEKLSSRPVSSSRVPGWSDPGLQVVPAGPPSSPGLSQLPPVVDQPPYDWAKADAATV